MSATTAEKASAGHTLEKKPVKFSNLLRMSLPRHGSYTTPASLAVIDRSLILLEIYSRCGIEHVRVSFPHQLLRLIYKLKANGQRRVTTLGQVYLITFLWFDVFRLQFSSHWK